MVDAALAQIARIGGSGGPGTPVGGRGGPGRAVDDHVKEFRRLEREAQRSARERERIERQQLRASEQLQRQRSAALIAQWKQEEREHARAQRAMAQTSENTARAMSGSFTKHLGVAFFAALAVAGVRAFYDKARDFISRATALASETQKALLSASAKAEQFGLSDADTKRVINNLQLVRLGMASTGDAAVAFRNLLSRFTPEQSIELLNRFADSLAFGKREAISYGEALKAGTQGLKNLESATVDNLGFGKNLSTIMKEQGLKLEDLDDKTKKAKATQALYNGILKETVSDMGNATRWAGTYSGALAQQEVAQQNLLRTVGDAIINSPRYIESVKLVTVQLNGYTSATADADSETAKFAKNAISAFARIQASIVPFTAYLVNIVRLVGHSLALIVDAVAIGISRILDVVLNTVNTAVNRIIDALGAVHNGIRDFVSSIPGVGPAIGSFLPGRYTPGDTFRADFNSAQTFIEGFNRRLDTIQGIVQSQRRLEDESTRIDARFAAADRGGRAGAVDEEGLRRARQLASEQAGGGSAATERRKKQQKVIDDAEDFRISEVKEIEAWFKSVTGRNLPISALGQSAYHNKLGLDHRNAVDVALHPNSPEGRLLIQRLQQEGAPYRAFTGPYRNAQGVLTATGAHIHIGQPSHAFGKNVRSRALTRSQLENETTLVMDAQGRFVSPAELTAGGLPEGARLLPFGPGTLSGIQQRIQAMIAARRAAPITEPNNAPVQRVERETSVMQARKEKDAEYFGHYEEVAKGVYERVGGKYQELADRQANIDRERADQWRDAALEREHRELDYIANTERAEATLHNLRMEHADDQLTEQRRLLAARNEELELTERLAQLQDEFANSGVNAALKQQIILQEELNDLHRAEEEAIESQIRSHVRLENQTVFSANRANAAVLEYLASQRGVTEVISDFRINVISSTFEVIDSGLERMTRKLGLVGEVLRDLISGFIRLALNRAFQSMMLGGTSGQAAGGGFSFGGFFRGLFGGGGGVVPTGGFAGGNPAASILGGGSGLNFAGTFNSGRNPLANFFGLDSITPPVSLSQQSAQQQGVVSILQKASGANATKPQGLFQGLLSAFKSPTGGLSGAGAATALAAHVGIFEGLFGRNARAALGPLGFLSPAVSSPFIAGFPLFGLFQILGRNKIRREEEKVRDQLSNETGTAIWQLIGQAKAGRLGVAEAKQQFDAIKARYFEGIGQLKDSKTKRIATETWNHYQALWPILEQNARQTDEARTRSERLIPAFADGGSVSRFMGRVPGFYNRKDDRLIRVSGNEVVLTPAQWQPIAPYLKAKNVPGFQSGGSVGPSTPVGTLDGLNFNVTVNMPAKGDIAEVVLEVMDSKQGGKLITRKVKSAQVYREL